MSFLFSFVVVYCVKSSRKGAVMDDWTCTSDLDSEDEIDLHVGVDGNLIGKPNKKRRSYLCEVWTAA